MSVIVKGLTKHFSPGAAPAIADVSFEEFVRLANANVILVSPSQLKAYIQDKTAKVTGN